MRNQQRSSSRGRIRSHTLDRQPFNAIALRYILKQRGVLLVATGLAAFLWIFHAVIDSIFFAHRPLLDMLLLSVEPHQVTARLLMLAVFWGFGLFTVVLLARCGMAFEAAQAFCQRNRTMLSAFPDLLFVLNRDGVILDYEAHGLTTRLVVPSEDVIGSRLEDVVEPDTATRVLKAIHIALDTGEAQQLEYAITFNDGARWYEARVVASGPEEVLFVNRDITAQKHTQAALADEAHVNAHFAALSQALLDTHDLENIAELVLEKAQNLTGSQFGYVGYIDPQTGYLVSPTLTRGIWDQCQVPDKSIVFKTFGGLWGWVLENQQAMYTNHPSGDPRSSGTPFGHVPIERFLSAPAVIDDKLVGQIALANPARDYTANDLELVTRLAAIYALAVQRKHSEDQLRFQAQLLDNVRESVIATDLDGQVIYWGQGAQALYGYVPEEVIDQPITMIVPSEDVEEELARVQHVHEHGIWEGRYVQRRKDGTRFHADTRIGLARNEDGTPFALIGVDRDVTEQVRNTEELRISEAKFRGVVEHSHDAICLIDQSGDLIEWNRACEQLTGLTRGDVLGCKIWDLEKQLTPPELWTEEMGERIQRLTLEILQGENPAWKPEPGERQIMRSDGERRIVQSIFFAAPHIDGLLGCRIVRDVTELHSAQQHEMNLQLEQERVRMLASFMEAASHEFRTPLAVIHTGLDVLERRLSLDSKSQEVLDRVKAYTRYFGDLVTATLKMSRLDSNVSPELRPVDINQLLSGAHDAILSEARRKAQQVHIELLDSPAIIQADAYDLQEALTHLLQNAVYFTPEGGQIMVQAHHENQCITLRVRDSGIGIDSEHLPHIFERFYRADRARTERRVGMGLAIARKIINLHGGDISVESVPGAGSTFTVVLPREPG